MEIDLRTVILITGISHLMQLLVFTHQYLINKSLKGPGWWLIWSLIETVGFAMILLRGNPALLPWIILFQDIVIFSGTVFVYIGIMRFFEKKVNLKFIIPLTVIFVLLHLFFYLVENDISGRTLVFDAAISLMSFYTAYSLYKNTTRAISSTARFNIILFVLHGLVFSYRTVMISMGQRVDEPFAQDFFNYLQFFDALLIGLLWTFGFIIMMNQKLNSDISEAKMHFEKIFNTSPDAAIISRLNDGLIVDCNEGYTKISGYSKEEIAGKSTLEINLWQDPADRQKIVKMIAEQGFFENFEAQFTKKNGDTITGLISAKQVTISEVPHVISLTRDITNRKKTEEEILLKTEELIKLNALKDKFFSIIAHDLRGPLGAFLGLAEMLADDADKLTEEEKAGISQRLKVSVRNLYNLLENLLAWSQLQKGEIPFNPQELFLKEVVAESLKTIEESAQKKGIALRADIPGNLQVFADTNMLQTIIRNLASNAAKFTQANGMVTISGVAAGKNRVEVTVRDNGIGMNDQILKNLFGVAAKSNRTGTSGEKGTGLGLVLCQEFIKLNGGEIQVESEEGKGSAFHFTLPGFPTP